MTRRRPKVPALACAFPTVCAAYARNSAVAASLKVSAFAATFCMMGPPWMPGKIALSTALAYSARHSRRLITRIKPDGIPMQLILLNVVITAIYTTGVLSAAYAAALVPPTKAIAASLSSGLVNGVATVLFTVLVDPRAAVITDQAMRGEIEVRVADTLVAYLIGSKFAGTLLAQLVFIPAAWVIAHLA